MKARRISVARIMFVYWSLACSSPHEVRSHPTPEPASSLVQPPSPELTATREPEPSESEHTTAPRKAARAPEDMVAIQGTEFFMGIDAPGTSFEQGRMTRVSSFAIDRLEVSVAQYIDCQRLGNCDAQPHEGRGCNATSKPVRLNHPMNCVTWHEADTYCRANSKRLPTEIEWELAARGTDRRPYPWGTEPPGEQLCWQGRKGKAQSKTCPVGSFPQGASPYGVLDMSGNVSEWTSTVVKGAFPPPIYAVRGGDYTFDPVEDPEWSFRRVDFAGSGVGSPTYPQVNVGFRCAKDVVED
jgi:formylglycine-generating enzyme required for sulfatase activity